jgi:hypothetical protein
VTGPNHKPSKASLWASYVLSALPTLFMAMSSVMKLIQPPMVIQGFAKSGISADVVTVIGVVELLCVVVYWVPPTAVLGAVLVTGYLGGAIFVHVRQGEIAFFAPLLLGMAAWGGLYLRDARIRALLPLRKKG